MSTPIQKLRLLGLLSLILGILAFTQDEDNSKISSRFSYENFRAQLGSAQGLSQESQTYPDTPEYRVAKRLQKRLRSRGNFSSPPISALAEAVVARKELLKRSIEVTFATEENAKHTTWSVSTQRYPQWISPAFTPATATFFVDAAQVALTLVQEDVAKVVAPTNTVITAIEWSTNAKRASKVTAEGIAKPGYLADPESIAEEVVKAFDSDSNQAIISLRKEPGKIINQTGEDLGDLTLWSTGRSNFQGSGYSRKANVRKALNEHVSNTIVRPGETFSFNSTLNGPVSISNGWYMAKVIFNGDQLEDAPGGGICQASTTVFRSALLAGFPIVDRRSHSLYVVYYEDYGVGIDATIYPGSQDFTFLNDSANPILIQSYTEGDDAYVHIYGTPDNRVVELEGPYFSSTVPEGLMYEGKPMAKNEILWKQNVTYSSGDSREYLVNSRYKWLPKGIAKEHEPAETVHAAAPVAVSEE